MDIAIPALVFGCVFLLALALRAMLVPRAVGRRLARLGSAPQPLESQSESLVHGKESGWSGALARIGRGREGADLSRLRSRLLHAGYRRPSAPTIYYGIRPTLAVGVPALVALLPSIWTLPSYLQIGLLILLSAFFYVLPSIILDKRIKARQHAITRALPDALDLMVVCVEAGFGINQSLAQVSEEFESKSPIVATEFALVVQETRAGKSTTQALRSLADRTGVSDISALVALLVQTERFGTSLAGALRVHADAMRVLRMQRAEERAQMATLKLILPSTMIFVALMVIFVSPGAYMLMSALKAH
jgi:tight adherence protein C